MLPWVECPSLNLRLDVSPVDRIAMIPDAVVQRSRELLAAVQAEIPGGKQWLADVVHLRTRYRFLAETKANANRVGVNWRDLTLANLSYELVVGMFACSKATNEVNYLAMKFMRTVLGTNNIDSCNRT